MEDALPTTTFELGMVGMVETLTVECVFQSEFIKG